MQNIVVQKQEEHVSGRRLKLIRDMAESLKYVHSMDYIHRDICPRNFICLPGSTGVKLIDFGLTVPATPPFMAPGNRTGTPLYMSPEIVRRRATDRRVDIFVWNHLLLPDFVRTSMAGRDPQRSGGIASRYFSPQDLLERCPNVDPRLARAVMNAPIPMSNRERHPWISSCMPSATLSGFLWTSRLSWLSSLRPRRWFSPQDARRKTRRQAAGGRPDRSSYKLDSARTCQICILGPVLGKKVPRTAAIGLLNPYMTPSEVGLTGITTSGDVVKRGFSAIVCPNLTTLCGIVVKNADI